MSSLRGLVLAPSSRLAYRMPPFSDRFVRRHTLVKRLTSSRDVPVVLIVAPAGYGKSTLLAEWADSDERPFVRVAGDARDPQSIASSIAQAFVEADRNFVVVLEDAHLIAAPVLRAVVLGLTEQLGPGSQVAVASRTEPPLPVGRLRAHRELLEVRTDDLRMDELEAARLLGAAGVELEASDLQALLARAEGWPAALYLAALGLRGQGDGGAGLRSFRGDHREISEYLRDEFLSQLSPENARFLIRSSVLDHLSGPLCDATLEQTDSAVTLAGLARSTLIVRPLDPQHERYCLHGLFKDMLRAELRRIEPRMEPELHRRASTWLQSHQDVDRAIDHAVAAGDARRAGALIWSNIMRYLSHGRTDLVQAWLDRFTPDQIAAQPMLSLAAAYGTLMAGNLGQARHWGLQATENAPRGVPGADAEGLKTGIAILGAMMPKVAPDDMARAAELEPEHSVWRPLCCWLQGTAEFLGGHGDSATLALEEGVELGGARTPAVTALCLAQLAVLAADRRDWDAASQLADRAAAIVEDPFLNSYLPCALVFAVVAAVRVHSGRADEAKRDLRRASELLAGLADFMPWYGAEARIMMARAALGLADTVRARTLLAEASRLARATAGAVIFPGYFDEAWAMLDTLAETALAGPSSLTIAELRILRFLPSHRSFREIAERLDVSVNTVKTQAHAIYRKLDAASRSEAVARATSAGLLGP